MRKDDLSRTYGPFRSNHEGPADNLSIFTDCPDGLSRVEIADTETVLELGALLRFCCLSERAEVFHGQAVFVWRVSEYDDMEGLSVLRRRGLGRLRSGRMC